jgi:hypothetical protein
MNRSQPATIPIELGETGEESRVESQRVGDQCNESRSGTPKIEVAQLARCVLGCRTTTKRWSPAAR